MKEPFTKEKLHETMMALDPATQKVFLSEEVNEYIREIQNPVPDACKKDVLYLITCTLLGLIPSRGLLEALTRDAGIPTDIAHAVCASLNPPDYPQIRTSCNL